MAAFIAEPRQKPDVSCVADLRVPAFDDPPKR